MIKKLAAICLLIAVSGPPVCAAVTDGVALDKKLCHLAPSELLRPLYIGWQEFGRYVHLCPVFGKNRKIALYVLTSRIDLGGSNVPFVQEFDKKGHGLPRESFILDVNKNIIGKFSGCFPLDPPDTFTVTFMDWREGFPFRIEFYILPNSLHGPERPAPLYWNATIGKFQDSPP